MILLLLSSITTDWIWLLIFTRFLDHTQRRTTVGRTPERVISSSQRPLPDNTQQSQQTNIHAHRRAEDCLFTLRNPTASAGFEPANLGTKGQHATSRPPKPLTVNLETRASIQLHIRCFTAAVRHANAVLFNSKLLVCCSAVATTHTGR